jgi:thioredoxin 1
MAALHLSDKDFEEKVLKGKGVFLIDFYADWCGPCKQAGPVIEELAKEYEGKLTVGKVNVDESQATAGKFGIMSIPTVIMFKDGQEIERMSGFSGKDGYVNLINKVIGE